MVLGELIHSMIRRITPFGLKDQEIERIKIKFVPFLHCSIQ